MKIVVPFLSASILVALPAAAHADCGPGGTPACAPYVTISSSVPSPHAGSPVTFRAHGAGLGPVFAWDLDGDGDYDDATGPSATASFPASGGTVSVRESTLDGRTATETRTLAVHAWDAAPVPTLSLSRPSPQRGQAFDVSVHATDLDGSVAKLELDLDGDGTYDVSSTGQDALTHSASFADAGVHTVRARVTDDAGATAVATAQLDVSDQPQPPAVTIWARAADGPGSDPIRSDADASITAVAYDVDGTIADYAFDLDGDGTYETDAGTQSSVTAKLHSDVREIGVRVTDSDGLTATSRRSVVVNGGYQTLRFSLLGTATVGVPYDVGAVFYGYSGTITYALDADGDGQYDDGTATGPGDLDKVVEIPYTFTTPGVHRVNVKATTPSGSSFTAMQTVEVREAGPPAIGELHMPGLLRAGVEGGFYLTPPVTGSALSYDLDGDGQFDDTPTDHGGALGITLAAPATVAVKATRGSDSIVDSVELAPLPGNLGAYPNILAGAGAPDPVTTPFLPGASTHISFLIDDRDNTLAFGPSWDLDGDGAYNQFANSVTLGAGTHTLGLRVDDHGLVTTVRDTFPVGAVAPPSGGGGGGGTQTPILPVAPLVKPPLSAPLTLSLALHAPRLASLLVHGLPVTVHCTTSCTAKAVLKLGKKTVGSGSMKHGKLTVKLTAAGKRALKNLRTAKLTLTVSAPGTKTITKHLTIKR